jgi:hypothetical protein
MDNKELTTQMVSDHQAHLEPTLVSDRQDGVVGPEATSHIFLPPNLVTREVREDDVSPSDILSFGEYAELRARWRILSKYHTNTCTDHILYAVLAGQDIKKAFSPLKNKTKLENQPGPWYNTYLGLQGLYHDVKWLGVHRNSETSDKNRMPAFGFHKGQETYVPVNLRIEQLDMVTAKLTEIMSELNK